MNHNGMRAHCTSKVLNRYGKVISHFILNELANMFLSQVSRAKTLVTLQEDFLQLAPADRKFSWSGQCFGSEEWETCEISLSAS